MIPLLLLAAAALAAWLAVTHMLLFVLAAAGAGVLAWRAFWPSRRLPRHRVRVMRIRIRCRLRPGRGHATAGELWWRWGRFAAFRRSGRSRRSLSAWQRARKPRSHSICLGRAQLRHALHLPLEEHALLMAPPRSYKTAMLASVVMHYPGPVLATTTKHDVFELTSGIRSRLGPVHVFNPQSIGNVPSTFRWDPIQGCQNPATAIRRADAITRAVSLEGTDDASFWAAKASSYMRALWAAAALGGHDMRAVVRWVLGDAEEAEHILNARGAEFAQWALELGELRGEAQKTAATIRMVLSRALAFMTDPALAASVLAAPGSSFSIPDFLRDRGTLYMIADSAAAEAPLAPLFAAMASEVHWVAVQLGQASPGGRLDPPLLMGLDEVTQICPIPLPVWLADSGGKGIQVCAVAHGEAQLATRWKDHGKRVILDTAGVKVLMPGISDPATLKMAADLCGQAAYREHGQEHWSRHDVMTADMVRQLPAGRALVIRGGLSPVVVTLPRAWREKAYRQARRRGQAIALPAPAPTAVAAPLPPRQLARAAEKPAAEEHLAEVLPGPWGKR